MMYVGAVIGYALAPDAFSGLYVRSALTVAPATAACAPSSVGAMKLPDQFLILAVSSFAARNYGFTRLSDLIKAVPNFEVKSGDEGLLLVKRLR